MASSFTQKLQWCQHIHISLTFTVIHDSIKYEFCLLKKHLPCRGTYSIFISVGKNETDQEDSNLQLIGWIQKNRLVFWFLRRSHPGSSVLLREKVRSHQGRRYNLQRLKRSHHWSSACGSWGHVARCYQGDSSCYDPHLCKGQLP